MSLHNTFVATYANHKMAEHDIEEIQNAGFDMRKLRIVAHNPYHIAEQYQLAPVLGSFDELDLEFFNCIPEQDIVDYEAELGTEHLFIVAHGLPDEIDTVKRIADLSHPTSWDGVADAAIYYGCPD
jgi:hypothetical protein